MSVRLDDGRAAARRGQRSPVGGAPGPDRDRSTAATVRLPVAEGLPKFSVRRPAADLGATAVSLYWYVGRPANPYRAHLDPVPGTWRRGRSERRARTGPFASFAGVSP